MIGVKRFTVSLPDKTFGQLEEIMNISEWPNRSQVISSLIRNEYLYLASLKNDELVAGSITLFYREDQRELLTKVSGIQRENIKEVINTTRILLEDNFIMEIIVVQGKVRRLEEIKKQFLQIKGVETGNLTLTTRILLPIQSK
ncbi:MAG: CopG family ribbon-helix-helix protein [Bacteroides sp.]|nr:CopG family ribbon-helix-helix protein [Bacteroides sp.]